MRRWNLDNNNNKMSNDIKASLFISTLTFFTFFLEKQKVFPQLPNWLSNLFMFLAIIAFLDILISFRQLYAWIKNMHFSYKKKKLFKNNYKIFLALVLNDYDLFMNKIHSGKLYEVLSKFRGDIQFDCGQLSLNAIKKHYSVFKDRLNNKGKVFHDYENVIAQINAIINSQSDIVENFAIMLGQDKNKSIVSERDKNSFIAYQEIYCDFLKEYSKFWKRLNTELGVEVFQYYFEISNKLR